MDEEEILELSEDSLEMLFQAMKILKKSIVNPELQKDYDILEKAFQKYMTEE